LLTRGKGKKTKGEKLKRNGFSLARKLKKKKKNRPLSLSGEEVSEIVREGGSLKS